MRKAEGGRRKGMARHLKIVAEIQLLCNFKEGK